MELSNRLILILPLFLGLMLLYFYFPSKPSVYHSIHELDYQEFLQFTVKFQKSYSEKESLQRFALFNSNMQTIRGFNSFSADLKLSSNKFADLSSEEFTKMIEIPYRKSEKRVYEMPPLKGIPLNQDWRDEGAVSDVLNQGIYCKASWAIAAVGAVEGGRVAQSLLPLVSLSSQQVVDCDPYGGCQGDIIDEAYDYIVSNGLTSALVYPYTGMNQTCRPVPYNQIVQNVTKVVTVPSGFSSNLITAVAYTPVSAFVQANQYVWQFYSYGVITGFCGTSVNHAVLIVGYNQTAPTQYYTVKNSWGADWGESGYARIGITGGAGVCGIQTDVSYPIVAN